jgi:hypothetical protein
MKNEFLKVGDVVRAEASWEIVNDYPGKEGPKSLNQNFNLRALREGNSLLKILKGSFDFVVVKTNMTGGGTGHGPHDIYPDGHEVTIRQLKRDGSYNDKGAKFYFYQSGSFNCMITDVTPVRKMKQTFVAG